MMYGSRNEIRVTQGLSVLALACLTALAGCGNTINPPGSGTGGTAGFGAPGGVGGASGGAGGVGGGGVGGTSAGVGGVGSGGTGGMTSVSGGMGATGGAAGDAAGIGGIGGTMAGEGGGDAGGVGGGDAGGGGAAGGLSDDHCLAGITNFDSEGPFTFQAENSGAVNMWIPDVPAGCKVPMVHLANGTGASCGSYRASLERLASHGFIALCYESTQTGAGTQAVMAWDAALAEHADIADLKFGSTGHSQGGQSSFCALRWAEEKWMGMGGVFAGLAMQPASGFGAACSGGWQSVYAEIVSPMFMFSGQGTDGLVPQAWVQDGFDALNDSVEAYHWAKAGGSHIPVPNGEEMQISIPWFRWKLLGDNEACKAFKNIRETDTTWEQAAVQNEVQCQ